MTKKDRIKLAIHNCLLLILLFVGGYNNGIAQGTDGNNHRSPNIILIVADDLGYSDLGYMNHKPGIQTPNIDQLARRGMVFTDAYAACPVCSPTRASLLTGKYPATLKITNHIPGIGMEMYNNKVNKGQGLKDAFYLDRLPLSEITIAEALKEQGYITGFFGKWHLAGAGSVKSDNGIVDANSNPDKQGFDVNIGGCAYGQPPSYFSPYKNETINDGPDGEYLTDRLGDEAVKFIETNKDRLFFLDLSSYTVHKPLRAPDETIEKYNGNTYFAMIEKLDQNVGKIMDKVQELNLLENTVIIFYSDNGGVFGNQPLRGNKCSLYEGGIRVPLIVSWPNKIEEGSSCPEPVTSVDFFPTFLELANGSIKSHPNLEGLSIVPLLYKENDFPNRAIYWHFPHNRAGHLSMGAAIRQDDWKLIKEFESGELHLFNLKEDIGETKNVVNEFPEKAKKLLTKLENWQNEIGAEMPRTE